MSNGRVRASPAEPQAGKSAKRDGADLGGGRGAEEYNECGGKSDGSPLPVWAQAASHSPNRLRNDCHGNEFQAVQQPCAGRAAKQICAIGEQNQSNGRGERKAGEGRKRASKTGPHQPNREAGLAARRSRQELAQANEIGKGLLVEPAAADNEFLAEIAQMRDRPAERGKPQLQKDP